MNDELMTREDLNKSYWTGYLNERIPERKHESGLAQVMVDVCLNLFPGCDVNE